MGSVRILHQPDPRQPLDPDLIRLVEALAEAMARRDHRAALAQREAARAQRK